MSINHNAPVIVSCEITIDADAEIVWDVLTRIEDWPAWNPKVKSATVLGDFQVGAQFHWKTGVASITSTIENIDRPRSICWSGRSFGVTAFHMHGFQPLGQRTLVRTVESWDGPLVGLLRVPIRNMLQESLGAGLNYLKAECERMTGDALSTKPFSSNSI